jgi:hypothetical protein
MTVPTLDIPAGMVGYDENSIVTVPISAPPGETPPGPPPPEPARRWALPAAVAFLILAVVAGAVMLALSLRHPGGDQATPTVTESAQPAPSAPATAPDITDGLTRESLWKATALPNGKAHCEFDNGLVATREDSDPFKCKGPQDEIPPDLRAEVNVRLLTPDSCATIWFRNVAYHGYQLRVCERNIYLGEHGSGAAIPVLRTMPLGDNPIAVGAEHTRIGLVISGDKVQVSRDGIVVGDAALTVKELQAGRLLLGVHSERDAPRNARYEVAFTDLKIWYL